MSGAIIIPAFKYRKKKKVYRASEIITAVDITWKIYFICVPLADRLICLDNNNVVCNMQHLPRKTYGYSFLFHLSEKDLNVIKEKSSEGMDTDKYIASIIDPILFRLKESIDRGQEFLISSKEMINSFTGDELYFNFDIYRFIFDLQSSLQTFSEDGYNKDNLKVESFKGIEVPKITTRLDEWWEWVYE